MIEYDFVAIALVVVGLVGLGLLFVDVARPDSSTRWQLVGLCLAVQPCVAWLVLRAAVIHDHRAQLFVPEWLSDDDALVPLRGLQYADWPTHRILSDHHLSSSFEVAAPAILLGVLVLTILRSLALRRRTGGGWGLRCEWRQLAVALPATIALVVIVFGTSLIDMAPRYLCCLPGPCPPSVCMAAGRATGIFQASAELVAWTPFVVIGAWLIARMVRGPDPERAQARVMERWPTFVLLAIGLGAYALSSSYAGVQYSDSTCYADEPAGFDPRLDHPITTAGSRVQLEDPAQEGAGSGRSRFPKPTPSTVGTPRLDASLRANPELPVLEVILDGDGLPLMMRANWTRAELSELSLEEFQEGRGEVPHIDESDSGVLMLAADDNVPAWALEQLFVGSMKLQLGQVIAWAPCTRERVFPGFGLVRDEVPCEIGVIELGHAGEPLAGRSWPELTQAVADAPGRVLKLHPPCRQGHDTLER